MRRVPGCVDPFLMVFVATVTTLCAACTFDVADTGSAGGAQAAGGSPAASGGNGVIPGTDAQVNGGGSPGTDGTPGTGGGGVDPQDAGPVVPPPADAFSTPPPPPPPADAAVPAPDLGTGYVSCAEAPGAANDCFSNFECAEDRICRNIGSADLETPCCVPGPRGTLPAGSPCEPAVGETTCASSVCIEGDSGAFCSTTCQQAADCPAGMQVCQFIAFSTSEEMWCFPESVQ